MDTSSASVRCVVVTPETTFLDETTDFVALPAYDGEVGVLPGRAPLVARLGAGELRLGSTANSPQRFFIDGGFGQVRNNVVTILTPRARPVADLHTPEIEQRLAEVNAETPTKPEAFAEKDKKLTRLRAQLLIAKRSQT